ncbi:MAG TPA: hypothetical protein VEJ88_07680, partial [Dissulfurispiraceae bacterium]|nr:hypothetical protein [Dissulfurispiraceae bacterium]
MPKPTKKKQKRTDQTRLDKPVAGIANEKSFMRDLIFLVALSLGLLFFFKDAISGMRTLIWDAADAFYPYLFSVSTAYRNMEIPLWNPFFFNGYPLFANIQAQTFYPLNFLFFPFTSFTPYVVQLSLILHFLLAGVFMYLLGRNYFENRWACALSATVYMLSGFMVGHMEHLTIIESMAWFPLVFLLFEKALAQKNLFFSLLAGFFFGISILAGHPQTCHIMYFILFIHALYRIATQFIKEKTHAALLKSGLVLLVFSIAGLLISAVQVVPTLELAKASTRAGALPFEFAARSGQLSLNDLSILILPNYFGAVTGPYWGGIDISQNLLYTGIVPLFLAGFVLINVKKNYDIIYFFLMMIFSLLL